MKLDLTPQDLDLLVKANIPFLADGDYDCDGVEDILEQVYGKEIDYVQADDQHFARLYADLADKIEDQRAVVYGR